MRIIGLFVLGLGMVSLCQSQMANEYNRPLGAVRAESVPVIDGKLDDDLWSKVPKNEGFWDRTGGNQTIDQTQFSVCYDDKAIYVAFWCAESQPASIVARETNEDSRFGSQDDLTEDHVDFRIDPFLTANFSEMSTFSVNAIGTRSARIGGGRARKTEWKGAWTAAVQRTESGWSAEIAIPWEMLNYPNTSKPTTFGINAFRYQTRTRIQSCWSNVGQQFYLERQGLWQGVVPPKKATPKVSILPYVLLGYDDDGHKGTGEIGADFRYPFTSELTAVATVNPDFGTIEGAVESINFSRNERFISERRPFFLEGESFFSMGQSFEISRLFYARRIDDFDLGIKLYGKATKVDSIGLLHTTSFGDRNDSVFKYTRQLSPTSDIQAFYNQKESDGDDGSVAALKYQGRSGALWTSLFGILSDDNGTKGQAGQLQMSYDLPYLFFYGSYRYVSDDFRAVDGLTNFTGFKGSGLFAEYNRPFRTGYIRNISANFDYTNWDKLSGSKLMESTFSYISAITENDDRFELGFSNGNFEGELDRYLTAGYVFGNSNRLRQFRIGFDSGVLGGNDYQFYSAGFSLRLGKSFDVAYSTSIIDVEDTDSLHILSMSYELSPTRSYGGRVVARDEDVNAYFSYRDSGKKGTEYFVILGDPNAEKFRRILQIKVVFSF